jgi:hypothetical protein
LYEPSARVHYYTACKKPGHQDRNNFDMNHNNMLLRILLVVLLGTSVNCKPQPLPTSEEFDRKASSYFAEHFDAFDLSPLDEFEVCTLKKVVANDLGELGGSRLTIVEDRFLLRSYFERFLQLHFCFIQDVETGEFYFVSIPQLDEYVYDVEANYVKQDGGMYQLKSPRQPIKMNTRLLSDFLSNIDLGIKNTSNLEKRFLGCRKVNEILDEAFIFLPYDEISHSTLQGRIKDEQEKGLISTHSLNITTQFIEASLQNEHSLRTFYIDGAGYLLSSCSLDKETLKAHVDMFFLPDEKKILTSRVESIKYRDCLENRMQE